MLEELGGHPLRPIDYDRVNAEARKWLGVLGLLVPLLALIGAYLPALADPLERLAQPRFQLAEHFSFDGRAGRIEAAAGHCLAARFEQRVELLAHVVSDIREHRKQLGLICTRVIAEGEDRFAEEARAGVADISKVEDQRSLGRPRGGPGDELRQQLTGARNARERWVGRGTLPVRSQLAAAG